ncbi:MAG: MlaD family protein [Tannerellaceae bacterium]|nr:MlaD family protein [Tannerellaceae bacterium]MCD8264636.1 MlaD family protein [Tannerellaceae bacterium]
MKTVFTKEAKIGIVTIISLALLYIGLNYLKGINLFQPVNHYYVTFSNVKDVTISSPVFVEGFKVGLVRDIKYDYSTTDNIQVEISLEKDMKINKGSYITIVRSLPSGGELHIHLNKYVNDYLKSGSVIEGRMEEDIFETVQDKILPGVEGLLPKLDSILGGIQMLVNHSALTQSLNYIESTTSNLNRSTRKLDHLLSEVSQDMPVIMDDLKLITGNFAEVSTQLKGLDLTTTVNSINQTLDNLQLTTSNLNSPNSSLGLLLNDKTLYDNLNNATENASKLLIDFREHPKRYVRFSVF